MIDLGRLRIGMLQGKGSGDTQSRRSKRRTFWKGFTSFERVLVPAETGFEKQCFARQVNYG